jgi:hypothetical protein
MIGVVLCFGVFGVGYFLGHLNLVWEGSDPGTLV